MSKSQKASDTVKNRQVADPPSDEEVAAAEFEEQQMQAILATYPMYRVLSKARGAKPDSAFGKELEFELNNFALAGYACLHAFMPDSRTFHAVLLNTVSPAQRLAAMRADAAKETGGHADEDAQSPT